MSRRKTSRSTPFDGENIETEHWQDARHWISIYDDLIRFKHGLLERVENELTKLLPEAQPAASGDLSIIREQMEGYYGRLDLWYERLWTLQGLWLDPERRTIRHLDKEASLTGREFQLLQFLLDHPLRFFSAEQIMQQAWGDSALFPEEVRNYILRVRRILARLELPCEVINRPHRGYSLVFRVTK